MHAHSTNPTELRAFSTMHSGQVVEIHPEFRHLRMESVGDCVGRCSGNTRFRAHRNGKGIHLSRYLM